MLSNLVDKVAYQGNGSGVDFPITFQIVVSDTSEVLVYVRDETVPTVPVTTLKTYGALQDYTLTGAVPPTTPFNNNVKFNAGKAPTANQKVILIRAIPFSQLLNLLTSGTFDFSNINTALDRMVAMIQMLNEVTSRAPLLNIATQSSQLNIPEPQANTVIGFDSAKALTLVATSSVPTSVETQVTVGDNTAGQALTSFSVDAAIYRGMIVGYNLIRKSSNGTLREVGELILSYDDTNSLWLIDNPTKGGKLAGTTFSVATSSGVGTVTFTTDSFSLGGSSYSGKIRYQAIKGFLVET